MTSSCFYDSYLLGSDYFANKSEPLILTIRPIIFWHESIVRFFKSRRFFKSHPATIANLELTLRRRKKMIDRGTSMFLVKLLELLISGTLLQLNGSSANHIGPKIFTSALSCTPDWYLIMATCLSWTWISSIALTHNSMGFPLEQHVFV